MEEGEERVLLHQLVVWGFYSDLAEAPTAAEEARPRVAHAPLLDQVSSLAFASQELPPKTAGVPTVLVV